MEAKYLWIVPSFYGTPNDEPLEFDITNEVRTFIKNKVWERGFRYGYSPSLKRFAPKDIDLIKVIISPLSPPGVVGITKAQAVAFVKEYCSSDEEEISSLITENNIARVKNITIFEANLKITLPIPPNSPGYIPFLEGYDQIIALFEEIGALFRAGVYLSFFSDYVIMPSIRSEGFIPAGFFCIEHGEHCHFTDYRTMAFSFPASFLKDYIEDFKKNLSFLAGVWHLPLWSVHRYLLALKTASLKMDNIIDLLFALEGLFEENVSSQFMRLICSIMLGADNQKAKRINSVLKEAFKIRNNIAHGGKSYTGMEKIKIEGKEVLIQTLFWEVRKIVGKMIWKGLDKLDKNRAMKNLRITFTDVLDYVFK